MSPGELVMAQVAASVVVQVRKNGIGGQELPDIAVEYPSPEERAVAAFVGNHRQCQLTARQ